MPKNIRAFSGDVLFVCVSYTRATPLPKIPITSAAKLRRVVFLESDDCDRRIAIIIVNVIINHADTCPDVLS